MCQHRSVVELGVTVVLADGVSSYWLAGILTIAAALVVTVVMLIDNRTDEDETT